jgi:hypothetical protein
MSKTMKQLRGYRFRHKFTGYQWDHWEVKALIEDTGLCFDQLRLIFHITNKPGWKRGEMVDSRAAGMVPEK